MSTATTVETARRGFHYFTTREPAQVDGRKKHKVARLGEEKSGSGQSLETTEQSGWCDEDAPVPPGAAVRL
ncbi:hypothetical protein MRX96_011716 [Rhipicephalus microplus]